MIPQTSLQFLAFFVLALSQTYESEETSHANTNIHIVELDSQYTRRCELYSEVGV